MRPRNSLLAFLGAAVVAGHVSADLGRAAYLRPAEFRVTGTAITPPMGPFSATVAALGNSLIHEGGAFEPVVYRNRFSALQDSPDRVFVSAEALSRSHTWPGFRADSLREGFYDHASVRIYRIVHGKFQLVREDSVLAGGSSLSGWVPLQPERQLVPAGTNSHVFQWEDSHRPGVVSHFTVRAVDSRGQVSAAADPVAVQWQGGEGGTRAANPLVDTPFRRSTTESPSLAQPKGLKARFVAGNQVLLEWQQERSPGIAGHAVYRSDFPPAEHKGYFLQLKHGPGADKQGIRAGDMVVVSKKFHTASRTRMLTDRAWGSPSEFRQLLPGLVDFFPDEDPRRTWELVAHERESPVPDGGETYLRLRLASGAEEQLATVNHSGTGQHLREVLEKRSYRVEVWLRKKGRGTVRFRVSGFYGSGPQQIPPVTFAARGKWKKFVATFSPSVHYTGEQPGRMALEFTGPGSFDIDNFRIYRTDAGHLDLLPEDVDAIRSSGMGFLRTHGFIKTRTRTYDLAQFTNAGGVADATSKGATLPQLLAAVLKANVRPWLQIEFHLAPAEWSGLVEYLAARYSPVQDSAQAKPWAYKRFKQGREPPWVDAFEKIYVELGNETWNRLFAPWIFEPMRDAETGREYSGGESYGLFQEYVISLWKSSPYWRTAGLEGKVEFVLGGQGAGTMQYAFDAAAASPSSALLTIGAYQGGWDEAEGPPRMSPRSLFHVLNHVNQVGIPAAERFAAVARDAAAQSRSKLAFGTYEAGPGYALDGLNRARVSETQMREQELVMKSLAAGTATLDAFLARAARGYSIQTFFAYGAGPYWRSHAPWHQGGKAHMAWDLLALFNKRATGEVVAVEPLAVPTADVEPYGRRKGVARAPLIAVYATRRDSRYNVFVISRKVPDFPYPGEQGFTPVALTLPFDRAASVTLFRLAGAPEASSLRGDAVAIEEVPVGRGAAGGRFVIDGATGADARGVPPGATLLYVFDGVDNRPQ